ncbi:MAG TPA: ABC transporter ATP-binding protein [Stellaceae bacterium]|nr:ABC transporter ATP-binding protein [Stellaceae bacterium]
MADGNFEELRLENVSRRFGGVTALDALSLTIKRGEFIALLGPSGCGKSTALNCLAGLLPLTGGGIWLDDRRIDVLRPEDRGFGMVFQNYALFPHMTVRRNIGFGLAMRRTPKVEMHNRVEAALRLVQLTAHADKLPGQLSGGQQQRVAIARAIVVQPPLVLMDEPLSNLDAKLRLEMRTEIRRIHRELGRSTIYVTHDQDEALSLADRIVVLKDGVTQQIGVPEDLYARPANIEVAKFMGYQTLLELPVLSAGPEGGVRLGTEGSSLDGIGPATADGITVGGMAVVTIRPEDLIPGDMRSNGIDVVATAVEYCGREFIVEGRTRNDDPVHFRSATRVSLSEKIRLGVAAERVRVFPLDRPSGAPPVAPSRLAAEVPA